MSAGRRGEPGPGLAERQWLAWTVFVTGDSYNGGRFSTRVGMLNVVTGETLDTLETFAIARDGRLHRPHTARRDPQR